MSYYIPSKSGSKIDYFLGVLAVGSLLDSSKPMNRIGGIIINPLSLF